MKKFPKPRLHRGFLRFVEIPRLGTQQKQLVIVRVLVIVLALALALVLVIVLVFSPAPSHIPRRSETSAVEKLQHFLAIGNRAEMFAFFCCRKLTCYASESTTHAGKIFLRDYRSPKNVGVFLPRMFHCCAEYVVGG